MATHLKIVESISTLLLFSSCVYLGYITTAEIRLELRLYLGTSFLHNIAISNTVVLNNRHNGWEVRNTVLTSKILSRRESYYDKGLICFCSTVMIK